MSGWATDIVSTLGNDNDGKSKARSGSELYIAEITGVEPLVININGQSITKHLYINPAYHLVVSDKFDKKITISGVGSGTISAEWYSFLEEFHKLHEIKVGDKVVVMQSRTSFYILEKVVAV